MFYTSGAQGPKRSRVRDWRPCGQWKECPRKLMDPSTLHWACQATVPGKRQPISHVRGPPKWGPVAPLVCLVDSTAVQSPDVIVGGIPSCESFGGRLGALASHSASAAHPFPHHVLKVPRRQVDPIHHPSRTSPQVERQTHTWCPRRYPHFWKQRRRRKTKKGVVDLSHLFSDPSPNGAQLGRCESLLWPDRMSRVDRLLAIACISKKGYICLATGP